MADFIGPGRQQIGVAVSPVVAASYLMVAGILLGCAKLAVKTDDSTAIVPDEVSEASPA